MPDARPLTRLLDELVWTLRREGFSVAPPQVIDILRAVRVLGWDDPFALREACAALTVDRVPDRPKFDAAFAEFFSRRAPTDGLEERLRAEGFTDGEVALVLELLDAIQSAASREAGASLAPLLKGGADVDSLLQLAGVQRELSVATSPLQFGFVTHRSAEVAGVRSAHERLGHLRIVLRDALGARGDLLADALAKELERGAQTFRARVRNSLSARVSEVVARQAERGLADTPFTSLTDGELLDVRRAVRTFAERLRGAERVRLRRSRHGRIDLGKTLRAASRTGGVPFKPARRRRRREKPRLLLLCDVSHSVRTASRFMLEFLHAAHDLFERTRSFVFVSEVGETTELFELERPEAAFLAISGGAVVPLTDNSNYGRALRQFEDTELHGLDPRTTVVILGDGRTNYLDPAEPVLARIRSRSRALYWLCPEPRAGWAVGDSAMSRYSPHCTRVFEVTTARQLEEAARSLASSR